MVYIWIIFFPFSINFQCNVNINKKMRDEETFSFCGKSQQSIKKKKGQQRSQSIPHQNKQVRNWREMTYRFEKNLSQTQKSPVYQSHYINDRIARLDEQLTKNIRRRIELQKKLYQQKQQVREAENEKYFKQNNCKSDLEAARTFADIEKKSEVVNTMLARQNNQNSPTQSYFKSIQEKQLKGQQYLSKRQKKPKQFIVPDQVRIQKLLQLATFPQIPQHNLAKISQQCEQLLIHSEHSDLYYILMATNFHEQKYHNVRKYFRQIQMYRQFEAKAYWIACETEFELESYELCLKLADRCMREISDAHLPRFVFLQARCYEKLGNFINSIVCYNQLIKMKPKVAELYLERAMIYDKIGYPMQAKQDYIEFSTLEPRAREMLREKIMVEKNQIKRKQMIKALAKIT